MNIIHNTHNSDLILRDGRKVLPDQFAVLEEEDNTHLLKTKADMHRINVYHIRRDHTRNWPDWMRIEQAVFASAYQQELASQVLVKRTIPELFEVTGYLNEKFPHVRPGMAISEVWLSLCCLPAVHRNMWDRVVLPELQQLCVRHQFHMFVAYRPSGKENRVDIKMFYRWKHGSGAITSTIWGGPHEYLSFTQFQQSLYSSVRKENKVWTSTTTTTTTD